MSTLASLTVRLGIDTDPVAQGARRASAAIRSIGATTAGMTRDADGNWRSLDGRVLSSAHAMMTNGQRMRDALGGIGQAMRAVGGIAAQQMGNGLRAGGQAGLRATGMLSKAFGVMSVGAVGAAGALAAVPLAVLGLGVKVAAENKQVQDAFTGLKDHVTKSMQSLAAPLVKPLADAAKQMQGIFDDIAPQLGQMFKAAAPMIEPLVAGIGDLVKGLVSGLVPIMEKAQPVVESLGRLFGSLGDALGGFLEGISSGIGAAAGVFDGLGEVVGALLPTLGELMGQMLKVAGPILSRLLTALAPVITQLGQALMPVIDALGPVLSALVDAFIELVQAVMPLIPPIMQLVVALLPAMTPIIEALVPLFQALGEVVAALVPILTPIITLVGQLATILAEQLAGFIRSVVVPAIKAVAALLRGDFSGAAELAKTAMRNLGEFVISLFTDLPGKIAGALGPLSDVLRVAMAKAAVRMTEAARKGVGDCVVVVKRLPDLARSALAGMAGVLPAAGRALIAGFITGIKSQIGAIRGTLKGITSMLPSWKGPEALDKKILAPNGRMVMSSFMDGIAHQVPALRRQLSGLTADLPGMVADVSPKGVFSASTRNSQTVVFDVTGADEDMKRLIRRIVKADGRGSVQTAFGTR